MSVALLVGAGCADPGAGFPDVPDAGTNTFARLRLALTLPRDGHPLLATEARLLRYRDLDPESAQILAGAATPAHETIAPGHCVRLDGDALLHDALASASPEAAVRMLDAGELVVTAAGRTMRLTPRWVPEIVPFVSGVIYEVDGVGAVLPPPELRDGEEAVVSAYGGPDVGGFDASAAVPAAPRAIDVNGQDPADGSVTLDRGASLDVRFRTDARAEEIALVISWPDGELRCRAAEPGRVLVPSATLAAALDGVELETVELAIERAARAPFWAAGLEAGEVEIVVRDVVSVRVM